MRFDFHISPQKLIRVSRFFPLCAPSIIFMTLSFTHEIHPMIREFLFTPRPVWSSIPFSMFACSSYPPQFFDFCFPGVFCTPRIFFSWSHITYSSPNFFSPPWCLQVRKFQNFPVPSPAGGFAARSLQTLATMLSKCANKALQKSCAGSQTDVMVLAAVRAGLLPVTAFQSLRSLLEVDASYAACSVPCPATIGTFTRHSYGLYRQRKGYPRSFSPGFGHSSSRRLGLAQEKLWLHNLI